ncbi:hypothetical protein C8R43DRAFT_951888 [Mycena crocata]|nr:hypothetical protein C8R43DRAFT_951888 [Mycena crocata]
MLAYAEGFLKKERLGPSYALLYARSVFLLEFWFASMFAWTDYQMCQCVGTIRRESSKPGPATQFRPAAANAGEIDECVFHSSFLSAQFADLDLGRGAVHPDKTSDLSDVSTLPSSLGENNATHGTVKGGSGTLARALVEVPVGTGVHVRDGLWICVFKILSPLAAGLARLRRRTKFINGQFGSSLRGSAIRQGALLAAPTDPESGTPANGNYRLVLRRTIAAIDPI